MAATQKINYKTFFFNLYLFIYFKFHIASRVEEEVSELDCKLLIIDKKKINVNGESK